MSILCLGNGLVGREFQRRGIQSLGRELINITHQASVFDSYALQEQLDQFDTIINCIAFTNTKPKTKEDFSFNVLVNTNFVRDLAIFCDEHNKKLVHISTGDIYGDSQRLRMSKAFKETDSTIVMTEYSAAKYLAEQFIDKDKHLILRPRLIFGPDNLSSNLITKLYKYTSFTPYINSFCSTRTLVDAALTLIDKQATGVFNVCNSGISTMLELAEIIRDKFDKSKKIEHAQIDSINNVLDIKKLSLYYKPTPIVFEFQDIYPKFLETIKA
jgi:dTDP-4-dehydrorhamnose reductase